MKLDECNWCKYIEWAVGHGCWEWDGGCWPLGLVLMRGLDYSGEIKEWSDRREHGLQCWTFNLLSPPPRAAEGDRGTGDDALSHAGCTALSHPRIWRAPALPSTYHFFQAVHCGAGSSPSETAEIQDMVLKVGTGRAHQGERRKDMALD